jgi:hypothetical protein
VTDTITVAENGNGVTRPPLAKVQQSPANQQRVIYVTRFGLAVVGYVNQQAKVVRHG